MPDGYSHFDYDASNILVVNDNISSILDFEGIHLDSLVKCLFFTLSKIYELQHSKSELELYLSYYQNVRRLNISEKLVIRLAFLIRFKNIPLAMLEI